MTEHLSTFQVRQLAVKALPEDEAVAAALHTAQCESCDKRFVDELKRQRGSTPFNFTLEPAFWFRDDHVDFELLVELADKTLDQETEEIVNIHLNTCETCREHVRSFIASREATAREMDVSYARPESQAITVGVAPSWQRLPSQPIYVVAAIVLLAVTLLIGVIALNKRSAPLEASKQAQTNSGIERGPDISPSPVPEVVSSPSSVGDSAKVLKDGGGEVTIDKNGRVTGLEEVSEKSRQYLARAVLSERIEPAEVLTGLSGEQSGLRGDVGPQEFRLLYPVRRVVIEDRPVFRWQSLSGASSYRVYVLDADGNQVSQSEELPPTQTQWKAPSLRRDQIFSWVVTAVVDGEKVIAPSASAPEIKFAVLSLADTQELSRLKKSNSHLALGVFYARVGLLNEAEREFQDLIKLNSQSELPRKLLQSVRSIKKAE